MKKVLQILAGLLLLSTATMAQTTWNADPAHTNVRFDVKHLGVSYIDGQFTKVEGSVVTTNATDFQDAAINFTIDVNSIDTRIEARNNHLKTDDFFNVEKFPTIKLKSVSFKK